MSRNITAATNNAAQDNVARPVLMVMLDFASAPVYANSSPYSFTVDGNEYLGVGTLGDISSVQEGTQTQAYGIHMTLSGIPTEMVSIALADHYQGRTAKIYLGLLDDNHQMIADPTLIFHGRIDVMDIAMGDTATIEVSAESRLADWSRPRVRRYTHEDQQNVFPADKGLEFVAAISDAQIIWGRA